jgi:Raf kinase inhibitor-like YbhB/YbcL family protein
MRATCVAVLAFVMGIGIACVPAACASSGATGKIEIKSSAFQERGAIPGIYTCKGKSISPPLSWSGVPTGTASLALIMDDPDAPRGTYVHWVVFNLPPDSKELPQAVPAGAKLDNGASQGVGTSGKNGYIGPCPPSGTHRYFVKIYALDKKMDLRSGATKSQLLKAMQGHIISLGQLMGTFSR